MADAESAELEAPGRTPDPFRATENDHAFNEAPSTAIIHQDGRGCRGRQIRGNTN
jgi:hypothetical protein